MALQRKLLAAMGIENDKIDEINYYPALEDVQTAVWTTPSLVAFEREVDKIAKQYEAEIQERRR